MMKEEISKEMIFNYFGGRATAFEKEIIDQWCMEPEGKEQFFIWLQQWENQNLQYAADIEKGIARHWHRRSHPDTGHEWPVESLQGPEYHEIDSRPGFFLMIAASVLVLLFSAGWLLKDDILYKSYRTGFAETQRLRLDDGSKIILNANSSLSVPRFGFGKNSREVQLTGEANFNVAHTKDHKRFIVHADKNLDIEVLGTEFNVYSRARGAKVVLNKGKVQLHYQEGRYLKQIIMKPGDLVTMDENGRASLGKTENPESFSAWKMHRFFFENATLQEVCHLFEDNFGVKVLIPDSTLAKQTISGSFTALNAEELLDILADDSGLSYQKSADGKLITLSY